MGKYSIAKQYGAAFDKEYKMYQFEKNLIFLRDVDSIPILMKETELLNFIV